MGRHLRWFFMPKSDAYEIVDISRPYFHEKKADLPGVVKRCDVIVHLAGAHPGNTPVDDIPGINMDLADTLLKACDEAGATPRIIFASSTHIERDTVYGRSKRAVGEKLLAWGERAGAIVTNLVIPNEFGEWGKPFHNTVVSTFAHQIIHGEESTINAEGEIELIYTQDVIARIEELIRTPQSGNIRIKGMLITVGDLYRILRAMHESYVGTLTVPPAESPLHRQLFNTLRTHLWRAGWYPRALELRSDARGSLFEMAREHTGGQAFISTTVPGAVRGNHYHMRKLERFCVIKGEAEIKVRDPLTGETSTFRVTGEQPVFIDMPTFAPHNITNIGSGELITGFWTDEVFDPQDPDTYAQVV